MGDVMHYPKKHKKVFVSAKDMKDQLSKNLHKPKYDVEDYYWQDGFCQWLAKHQIFENITLSVITFNAAWMAVDTDENTADTLLDAKPIFIVVENFFCLYFAFEITIRFCAFKDKRRCLYDAWFVFDTFLVLLYAFDPFVMAGVIAAMDGGSWLRQMVLAQGRRLTLFTSLQIRFMERAWICEIDRKTLCVSRCGEFMWYTRSVRISLGSCSSTCASSDFCRWKFWLCHSRKSLTRIVSSAGMS